ncbi:hypothetical protein QP992_02660 [Corynebacterium ulcerans]|uniref:hypothetical protein n=1 Tax=Corynebacterium ulcerans TaxID=65058 RepID=UPI0018DA00C7|nr:hypothetical protein [Corynebacterium ulcerans]MBH5296716.1 hypothetical protein [Corynebacterium ulcerans]MDK8888039.1 hypothetical protein [Corynebacterium ulcerans]
MSTVLMTVIAVLLTFIVVWAWMMAQRLNRLHIRTDSALQALQAALDRRAALVAALHPEAIGGAQAAQKIQLGYETFADRAEKERAISARIAAIGESAEPMIVDAEVRLSLAHRFYNDAVADTRALRTRTLVRWLRLGGTAKLPEFFEFADYV